MVKLVAVCRWCALVANCGSSGGWSPSFVEGGESSLSLWGLGVMGVDVLTIEVDMAHSDESLACHVGHLVVVSLDG